MIRYCIWATEIPILISDYLFFILVSLSLFSLSFPRLHLFFFLFLITNNGFTVSDNAHDKSLVSDGITTTAKTTYYRSITSPSFFLLSLHSMCCNVILSARCRSATRLIGACVKPQFVSPPLLVRLFLFPPPPNLSSPASFLSCIWHIGLFSLSFFLFISKKHFGPVTSKMINEDF